MSGRDDQTRAAAKGRRLGPLIVMWDRYVLWGVGRIAPRWVRLDLGRLSVSWAPRSRRKPA